MNITKDVTEAYYQSLLDMVSTTKNRELALTKEDVSQKRRANDLYEEDLNTRDRVDISLAEYKRMLKEIEDLQSSNQHMMDMLGRVDFLLRDIGTSLDQVIKTVDKGSIEVLENKGLDFDTTYSIRFKCRQR